MSLNVVEHPVRIGARKSRRPGEAAHGRGPNLGFPFSSQVKSSRYPEMRELRAQAGGDPLRMLYAFDPRRIAILLVAGDKTGDDRWYETNVTIADRLLERHLQVIEKERAEHG